MKNYFQIYALSALFAIGNTYAFFVPTTITQTAATAFNNIIKNENSLFVHSQQTAATTALWASDDKKKSNKGGFDEGMRTKLVAESIAPWRTLRLFLYGSLGSGAFIGGLINGSGAIAASASPDFDLKIELINLGIDFGAVIVFGLLARWDLKEQSELQGKVDERIEKKKEMKKVGKAMKERESILNALDLKITIGEDQTRTAKVSDLQAGAKQHMIIVAGPRRACKDALIGANILKMDFALSNVLVVPYDTETRNEPSSTEKGFGDRPSYEKQPYIATAYGEEWDEYILKEVNDAIQQNRDPGVSVEKDGIAIVVANNGEIIRRGVGTVPWRRMVEQLEETTNPIQEKKGPLAWLDMDIFASN